MNLDAAMEILGRDAITHRDGDNEARLERATAFTVVAKALHFRAAAAEAQKVCETIIADDEHQMRLFEVLGSKRGKDGQ